MTKRKFSLILPLVALFSLPVALQAQDEVAPVRFGIFMGANFNSVGVGGDAALGAGVPASEDLSDGTGIGPYGGLVFEYNPAGDQVLGLQARIGYDDRSAHFGESPNEVDGNVAYFSFEPGARINLGSPKFHFVAGPSLHVLARNDFEYSTELVDTAAENGMLNDVTFGLWGGVGFDIPISDMSSGGNQWYLTPFFEGSWIVDQVKSSAPTQDNLDDSWSTVTVRGGIQIKYGIGGPESDEEPVVVTPPAGGVNLAIQTPVGGVMAQRPMIEYLPLLNYIFYPKGTSTIPSKYVTLTSGQSAAFDENQLSVEDPGTAGTGDSEGDAGNRSERQLDVYYNIMNIVGDRLQNNPTSKITVVGSGPDKTAAETQAMNVKNYLKNMFGIDDTRISSRGQTTPVNKSGTRATPKEDLDLVAEENVRIEILSDDYEIVKPVKLQVYQDMPVENDMSITVTSNVPLTRWDVQVTGNGVNQNFGPFYGQVGYINATPILGSNSNGTYTATVTATDRSGNQLTNTQQFTLNKTNLDPVTSTRYSVLFEYDDSESLAKYDKFLRDVVAKNIPNGSVVYVHGHTDVAGLEDYNYNLSVKRADEAKRILTDQLKKDGKTGVTFESYGFGETQYRAPFSNDTPETRYYNRTVMIEIIPESN